MPSEVQFRRGSESENNNFLGAEGELSVNTSNNALRVHNGISTGGFELAKNDLSNVGIVTQFATEKLSIGNTEVLSLDFELKNISGIDTTTRLALETALQLEPNNFNDLSVTGITTIGGLLIAQDGVSVTGVVTASIFDGNLNATGLSTITSVNGTDVNYTNGYLNVGVVTTISGTDLTYTTGSLTTGYIVSGIVTTISGDNLSYTGVSTFSDGPVLVGSGTSTGTASQRLQVTGDAYVSGNAGIGTTNPSAKLEVFGGDVRIGIDTSQGLLLTSPNGTKYRLVVSDAGVLTTALVP